MTQTVDRPTTTPEQPKNPPLLTPVTTAALALPINQVDTPATVRRNYRPDVRGFFNPLMSKEAVENRVLSANRIVKLEATIATREDTLRKLSNGPKGIKPVIAKVNQKGGCGKTTDASSGSIVTGAVTGQTVIVVDNNQARGNTKSRLVEEETLPSRKAMATLGKNFTHNDVTRHLGHHPKYRNVYVIDSDTAADRAGRPITADEYYPFVVNLETASSAVVYDCGNEMDSVQFLVAISHCHVICFVAVPWVANAVQDSRDTMDHLRTAYPEKVANSVIVLTGCYENEMDAQYWAKFYNHPAEQIVFIPFDPAFEAQSSAQPNSPEREIWITDHAEFQLTTYLANLDREILTFKQAKKGMEIAAKNPETLEQKIKKIKLIVQAKAAMQPAPSMTTDVARTPEPTDIEKAVHQLIKLAGNKDAAGVAVYNAKHNGSS